MERANASRIEEIEAVAERCSVALIRAVVDVCGGDAVDLCAGVGLAAADVEGVAFATYVFESAVSDLL